MTMQQGPHLRPENVLHQAPAAMFEGAVLYSPPTMGYYWGWIAYYEPDRIPRMLKHVGEETAKIALKAFDIAIKAMGVTEPGPEDRLALYRAKPIELWHEQQAKFPWRYEHDLQDWTDLEAKYGAVSEAQRILAEVTDPVMPSQPKQK